MFYSNFPQNGINSNVLQNTSELITQARVKKDQNEFFPLEYGYKDTYKNKYDNMDDPTFWYIIHNGKVPNGYYAIKTGETNMDVRLVSSKKEKTLYENDYPSVNCNMNHYKTILDQDGIHAKVVVNEMNMYTKICSNCQKLFVSNSTDYLSNKNYFCSHKCKEEYLRKYPRNKVFKTVCYRQNAVK